MNAPLKGVSKVTEQSIEELQKRYQKLNTRKIEAGINLSNATAKLGELKQEAREKYGTDDLAELRGKLDSMKADNDEKRRKYQADLDRIDAELEAVERKFAAADGEPAPVGGRT